MGVPAPTAVHKESFTQTENNKTSVKHSGTQTPVRDDDRGSAILDAIAEVKVIIAKSDARVTEQQKLINNLQRQQEASSSRPVARTIAVNATDKQSVVAPAKIKPKGKKPRGSADQRYLLASKALTPLAINQPHRMTPE